MRTTSGALIYAAMPGQVDVVRVLLAAPGVDVNLAAEDGFTALSAARANGHAAVVALTCHVSSLTAPRPYAWRARIAKDNGATCAAAASRRGCP